MFFRLAAAAAAAAGATSELSYLAALHPAYRPVPYDHPLYGANTLRGTCNNTSKKSNKKKELDDYNYSFSNVINNVDFDGL